MRAYLVAEIEDHIDPLTGEANCTAMAEDAGAALDLYDYHWAIPEEVFEMADKVAEKLGYGLKL